MKPYFIMILAYGLLTVASTAWSQEEYAYLQEGARLTDNELAVYPPPPAEKEPETDLLDDLDALGRWLQRQAEGLKDFTDSIEMPAFESKNEQSHAAGPQLECTPIPGYPSCN